MHESYQFNQQSNQEVQRIIENIKRIKRLPKLKGVKEILYPGQNKQKRFKKNINKKINIPASIAEDLKKLNA